MASVQVFKEYDVVFRGKDSEMGDILGYAAGYVKENHISVESIVLSKATDLFNEDDKDVTLKLKVKEEAEDADEKR